MGDKLPIYHVVFPSKQLMGLTLMRFSEHAESPQLAGKIFDHETLIRHYMQQGTTFTYADDWDGFNLPSRTFAAFRAGHFDPLWRLERAFLELLPIKRDRSYVIATVAGDDSLLGHELAHALYDLYPDYASEARSYLAKHDLRAFHEHLRLIGYADAVLDDETVAYHLSYMPSEMRPLRSRALARELTRLFKRHFRAPIRYPRDARTLARRIQRYRFPTPNL